MNILLASGMLYKINRSTTVATSSDGITVMLVNGIVRSA
jgi:hypothetical protein